VNEADETSSFSDLKIQYISTEKCFLAIFDVGWKNITL